MYFDQMEFGKRLKKLRKEKGYTQEEMANQLNISREFYGRVERGVQVVSIDLLVAMTSELGTSMDYLVMGKDGRNDTVKQILQNIIEQLLALVKEM